MLTLVALGAAATLLALCGWRRRRQRTVGSSGHQAPAPRRPLVDELVDSAIEFLLPFALVSIVAAALSAWMLSHVTSEATKATLLAVEQWSLRARRITGALELPPLVAAFVLAGLYGLVLSVFPRGHRIPRALSQYRKAHAKVHAALGALTFFTFFGSGVGAAELVARGRINDIEQGHRRYGSAVAEAAREAERARLLERSARALQSDLGEYDDSLRAVEAYRDTLRRISDLSLHYDETRPPRAVRRSISEVWEAAAELERAVDRYFPATPSTASVVQVRRAAEEASNAAARANGAAEEALIALGIEGAREIATELVKAPTDLTKEALVGLAGSDYPLLEAVVAVFTDALHAYSRERVHRALQRFVNRGAASPFESVTERVLAAAASETAMIPVPIQPLPAGLAMGAASTVIVHKASVITKLAADLERNLRPSPETIASQTEWGPFWDLAGPSASHALGAARRVIGPGGAEPILERLRAERRRQDEARLRWELERKHREAQERLKNLPPPRAGLSPEEARRRIEAARKIREGRKPGGRK
jgi:hypothetical protein